MGVFFALSPDQEHALLDADESGSDDSVRDLIEEFEENWADGRYSADTDQAWDAIHRCLTDGTLDPDGGAYPLSHAVLGGRHLSDDWYVVYVSATEVKDVAAALREVARDWLRTRLEGLGAGYTGARDDADFEYTWSNFEDVREFYGRAAEAGRAVVFTAT
ncbi:hypothetical protein Val02_51280 [Virgisporangium aliadipatigenens]|uniref:DUF1877 family protein n=2 Tax=Virgisporangium aliadipatigenens TaxID=741659 RepID=A0A8J3YPL7_9ACTN|nr:hypothetical protein Val02_51280 [Virgisporangium aliadipatigenens]